MYLFDRVFKRLNINIFFLQFKAKNYRLVQPFTLYTVYMSVMFHVVRKVLHALVFYHK